MVRTVDELVSHVSMAMTLLPGDVILTGTPGRRRPARDRRRGQRDDRAGRHPHQPGGGPWLTRAASSPVRVRVAPSPTGDPHVGTAYMSLFNLAFAAPAGRPVHPADRGHRPGALRRRQRAAGLRHAALAGPRLGRGPGQGRPLRAVPAVRAVGDLPGARRPAARRRPRLPLLVLDRAARRDARGAAEGQAAHRLRPALCVGKTREERAALPGFSESPVVRMLVPGRRRRWSSTT